MSDPTKEALKHAPKRVWEETWTLDAKQDRIALGDGDSWCVGCVEDDATRLARAMLAAAAPDMVRALLAVEWSARSPRDRTGRCPSCGFEELGELIPDGAGGFSGDVYEAGTHRDGCAIDAALKKAGIR